jgi:hypothetical protein
MIGETKGPLRWLTPVTPASQEMENRRVMVQGKPGQKKLERHHLNKQTRFGDIYL